MSEMPDLSALLSMLSNNNANQKSTSPEDMLLNIMNSSSSKLSNQTNNTDTIHFAPSPVGVSNAQPTNNNSNNNSTNSTKNNKNKINNNDTSFNNNHNNNNNNNNTNSTDTNSNNNNTTENTSFDPFSNLFPGNMPDMDIMFKLMKVMKSANESSPSKELLKSLKPFLNNTRKEKVDQYINIIGMTKMLEIFNEMGGKKNE